MELAGLEPATSWVRSTGSRCPDAAKKLPISRAFSVLGHGRLCRTCLRTFADSRSIQALFAISA